jgi:hypothetical protein
VTTHVVGAPGRAWTFLSNHLHVLACIDHDPVITVGNLLDALRRRYANGSANGSLALVMVADAGSGSSVTNAL